MGTTSFDPPSDPATEHCRGGTGINTVMDARQSVGVLTDIAQDPKAALSQELSVSITYG